MPGITREEKESRVERDTGNPTDTVYSARGYHTRSYHDDRECYALTRADSGVRERSRGEAQKQLSPCRVCVLGEVDNSHEQGGISKLERLLRDDKEDPVGLAGGETA